MDKKITDKQVDGMLHDIIRQMNKDDWKPDYIIGLARGGLVPAVKLSHYLQVPMYTVSVSLRDNLVENQSNCVAAEDAFGCTPYSSSATEARWDPKLRKKILVVDDINDTGATFDWIKKDWESTCFPNERVVWDAIWGNTVRFAALINNESSRFEDLNYYGEAINKREDDVWVEFSWESWWRK